MKRVVITGLGALTPFGMGVDLAWDSIIAGKSALTNITKFDTENFAVTEIGAEFFVAPGAVHIDGAGIGIGEHNVSVSTVNDTDSFSGVDQFDFAFQRISSGKVDDLLHSGESFSIDDEFAAFSHSQGAGGDRAVSINSQ